MATTQAFETLTIPIAGMDCAGCATHVREAIAALPGVVSVDVQLGAERAIVRLDPTRVGLPAIRTVVAEAGYRVPPTADSSLPSLPVIALPTTMPLERVADLRAGVQIECLTIGYMIVEAVVAIGAGLIARSVLLTAFGFDSIIELITGGILLWRLMTEARGGTLERVEKAENRAAWVVGVGLVLLCVYVVVTAALSLVLREKPDSSFAGISLSVVALVLMPILARRKRVLADRIGSAALRGDAACSITCAYMAGALLVGLALNAAFGWWWADPIAALVLLYWLQGEAREAIAGARSGGGACSCGDDGCDD